MKKINAQQLYELCNKGYEDVIAAHTECDAETLRKVTSPSLQISNAILACVLKELELME